MQDEVGSEAGDAAADRWKGNVILGHVQPEDLVSGERRLQLAAKLALVAGDDNTHVSESFTIEFESIVQLTAGSGQGRVVVLSGTG